VIIIKGKKGFIIFLSILILSLIVPAISYSLDTIERINMILPKNVYIDEINLGGRPLTEAVEFLENRDKNILDRKIYIYSNYGESMQSHEFSLRDLGYTSNINEIVKEVSNILNNDLSIIDKYKQYKSIEEKGVKFKVNYTIDKEVFMDALEVFDDRVLKKPVNAELVFEDGRFSILGGDYGLSFDKDKLFDTMANDTDKLESKQISLDLKVVKPEITIADIENMGIKERVSTFTTEFNPGNKERSANIALAAKAIDGIIIPPNGVFSFNETVGKRTVERGYQEAGVYIRGKVDKGIGGGICQVSTTLYNALLFHDLEIIERSNHSLTVPYVPLSRDAAVDWGSKDLKFKNNTDYYIYIDSKVGKNKITFDLYSTKSDKVVKLESITLSKEDAPIEYKEDKTLAEGTSEVEDNGHTGYRSKLIKNVYRNGELVESKVVSKDRYLTTPKIIRINPLPSQDTLETEIINQED